MKKKSNAVGAVNAEKEEETVKANAGVKMKVELDVNSAADVADLRFPGLQATGGAISSVNAIGYEGFGSSSSSAANQIGGGAGHFGQMKLDPIKKTATVSLNDCLACSGCVTSAETVLITQQSIQEFLNVLQQNTILDQTPAAIASSTDVNMTDASNTSTTTTAASSASDTSSSSSAAAAPPRKRVVVVSISPQSLTALSHEFQLTPLVTARKLTTFFQQLGVRALVDTTPALDIALLEAREEFIQRFLYSQTKLQPHTATVVTATASSTSAAVDTDIDESTVKPTSSSPLPILSSECPGWICYCEKTQTIDILSHASSCKSPQAIMGTILKQYWAKQQGLQPDEIFHTSIMPCYDKKLEGSRDDFYLEQFNTRETDCVLTTSEVLELIRERSSDFASTTAESELDALFNVSADKRSLIRSIDVGASGGYCEFLFRSAAKRLFNITFSADEALPYKIGRNPDYRELSLEIQGKSVLNFAIAYGFRNIQNLVRKMKTKKHSKLNLPASIAATTAASSTTAVTPSTSEAFQQVLNDEISLPIGSGGYHYVEVMACPSGCLNGGGQIKAKDIKSQKQLVVDLDELYHSSQRIVCEPEDNPIVKRLYTEWLDHSTPYQGRARQIFHTQFHAVEKDLANPLGIKW